ncbi:MAG: periplasmic sugar-binding protein [Herbinix sp.]|jgi:putative multiple sugar transport system substrate-binding protein|nr:periplasmic sugar-binding protein [Herbinix sp.]
MKKIIAMLLCLSLVFSLAACGSKNTGSNGDTSNNGGTGTEATKAPDKNDGSVDVGIVLPTKDEPRWLQDQARFEDVISSTDYTVEVLFSQGSSANEKTNVETLIAKGIKVLIICAQDAAAAAAAVEEAKDAGVIVISYDRLITDTDSIDYYVTFDSVAVGTAMGQYLVDNATGTGNPLYLYAGAATDNNAFLFFEGAWNVLQPKIADGTFVIKNSSEAVAVQDKATLTRDEQSAIIGQVTTNWDFNEAKSKAEAHLTSAAAADKGKCYVLAPNDGTARSIADVFAADADVTDYFITGQDAEVASVQYIIDGKQSMTVFKDTRTLAADAMNMAIEVIEGKTPATDSTYNNLAKDVPSKQTATVVVTKDNVKSALIDSGYYDASEFTGLE